MVLLAATICTKTGKPLISRQFVEITRSRIEGLIALFPKLISTDKQHTFIETDTVRFVYQPLDTLYIVLLTTKASNIFEDLETLRLFSRTIPEYCKTVDEQEILKNAFDLLFAFDEIIALGYKENVNLAQIRTYTDMDSYDEIIHAVIRKHQEREAKDLMKQKAKEFDLQRRAQRLDSSKSYGHESSIGTSSNTYNNSSIDTNLNIILTPTTHPNDVSQPALRPSSKTGKAMKLTTKGKNVESFVNQLKSEGEIVANTSSLTKTAGGSISKTETRSISLPDEQKGSVHLKQEEKLSIRCGRDGGIETFEVHGMIILLIKSEEYGHIVVAIDNQESKNIQLQTHPNIDKKLFINESLIGLKNSDRSFPINQEVGILKWRYTSTDLSKIPLSINCWPNETANGGCDVNIQYELQNKNLILKDVHINVPLPAGGQTPIINQIDGNYEFDNRKTKVIWSLPVIDQSNFEGSLEFSIRGKSRDFFPIQINFISQTPFCNVKVTDVKTVDKRQSILYSNEINLIVEKYEYV